MLICILECLSQLAEDHPIWTSILTILVSAHVAKAIKNWKFRLPPGPTGLPFLGYLPFLEMRTLHVKLMELQKIYGKVFSLQLGSRYAVVLSDFKSIKEANLKDEFSARPPNLFKLSDKVHHFSEMNGKEWKESSRFTQNSLRTLAMGNNKMEDVIRANVSRLLEQFTTSTGKTEINLHSHLYEIISNTIISLVCGRTLSQSENFTYLSKDVDVEIFTKRVAEYFEAHSLTFFYPYLSPLLAFFHTKVTSARKELDNMEWIVRKEIEAHQKDFDEANLTDYMDLFIAEMNKGRKDPSTFVTPILNGNSQLLLLAGADTTRTNIEWALLCMAEFPEVQERIYRELVQVLDKGKSVSWAQREHLPYLGAVLMEVARWKTVSPLSTPHWTLTESKVNFYNIPKDAYIINNIHAVHMDPALWDKPELFNPDRFLNASGALIEAPEYFIPYSYGKRMCPGMTVANMMVFLFVASVLQQYMILPPSSGLNMTGSLSFTYWPNSPFVKIQSRE